MNEAALLWRITGNDLRDTSYLLGTMHTVEGSFLNDIPGFRKAFRRTKQLATEIDYYSLPTKSAKSKKKNNAINNWRMPIDTTYEQLYSDVHKYQTVDSALKVKYPTYEKMKPAFWIMSLGHAIQYSGLERNGMMDAYILLLGYHNSKDLFFMETIDSNRNSIDSSDSVYSSIVNDVSLSEQAESLFDWVNAKDSVKLFYDSLKMDYKQNGLKSILCMMSDESELISFLDSATLANKAKIDQILISDRNEKWMINILPNIRKASSLIAVGAKHLIGKDGLIAKLRSLGYKVEPVTE
ncbi:MAG: TraB/GumN family protein [Mediterranea sp.]|nr:TraB/GumN family protein [Mediterranea sp.]